MKKYIKTLVAVLAASMMFSATASAAEDELELVKVEKVATEELVEAGKHGSIYPNPKMYDMVGSNNTKIELEFDVRTFGNELERFEIKVYKGKNSEEGTLVARKNDDFAAEVGSYSYTYTWDTTAVEKYPAGDYCITATSYFVGEEGDEVNNTEEFSVTLEDYRLVLDRQFVERLYETILGRKSDADGLKDWSTKLFEGKASGASTVVNIIYSPEFQSKKISNEDYVEILYKALFDRAGDAGGKANWVADLEMGMSRGYVLKGFIESTEFKQLCDKYSIVQGGIVLVENRDKNKDVTGFVSRLYNIMLDRAGDVGGLNDWTGKLLEKKQTPKQVAYGFVFSKEMTERNLTDKQFVTMLYNAMMDREPDDGGLKNWTDALAAGKSKEEVFNGFADSTEFANIVKAYGL